MGICNKFRVTYILNLNIGLLENKPLVDIITTNILKDMKREPLFPKYPAALLRKTSPKRCQEVPRCNQEYVDMV